MKIEWRITDEDAKRVKNLIDRQKNNALVRVRIKRNCASVKRNVRRGQFWQQMVSMRLTSQQNSSPDAPVGRFARERPFPLRYEAMQESKGVQAFITNVLTARRGLRFVPTISAQLAENFEKLEKGEWDRTLKECNRLTVPVSRATEVEVATYIQEQFIGFGPKQARNLLQALALTRYEIPIDSRLTEWLNDFGFPVRLSASALADTNYYNFVSEGIQELCVRANVLPCVFDAAIFALKDGDTWTAKNAF